MLLAIDIGNTNIIFAVYQEDEKKGSWRCATDPNRTADEYAVWLKSLMVANDIDLQSIHQTILASVVPSATIHLVHLCQKHFDCPVMEVGSPSVKLGIEIKLPSPEEVGADRLVNAISAANTYQRPLIVVDFGTATTFDVIDEEGSYCGGVIASGICKPRPVATSPGWTAFTVTWLPSKRFANSRVNSILASLECPYTFMSLNPLLKFKSSKFIPLISICAPEATLTIRAGAPLLIRSNSRLVSKK